MNIKNILEKPIFTDEQLVVYDALNGADYDKLEELGTYTIDKTEEVGVTKRVIKFKTFGGKEIEKTNTYFTRNELDYEINQLDELIRKYAKEENFEYADKLNRKRKQLLTNAGAKKK